MLEAIISNYIIFIVIAVVLLLGLFGYMIDRRKYKQYHEEIANESHIREAFDSAPEIQNVATPVETMQTSGPVLETPQQATIIDPMTGEQKN